MMDKRNLRQKGMNPFDIFFLSHPYFQFHFYDLSFSISDLAS